MKLLIVEDSLLVRERLVAFFAALPALDVAAAVDAAGATARFRAWRPDLAILDIELPDGSGIGVLRTIKRERPATRVLMFSNHAACCDACLAAGADAFFDKTADFEAMAAAVGILAFAAPHDTGEPS